MEPNNDSSGLSSYYHHSQFHHQPRQPPPPATSAAAVTTSSFPTNGGAPNSTTTNNSSLVYPHTVPSAVSSPPETVRRKRGRPRKYGSPEQAAAAKRLCSLASSAASSKKKGQGLARAVTIGSSASSSKESQLAAFGFENSRMKPMLPLLHVFQAFQGVKPGLKVTIVQENWSMPALHVYLILLDAIEGITGQGFATHIIPVMAGEDVGQKIMQFVQQSKREICITVMSANGYVSGACLQQPASSGGSIKYEGVFDILSLSGSYTCTGPGERTGGLRVCLSTSDGHVFGGGVGGPLTAAVPIQVIVGTFEIDKKKDIVGKSLSPVHEASIAGISFHSPDDSTHQAIGGSQYNIQHQSMQATPSQTMNWRDVNVHQSSEKSDY